MRDYEIVYIFKSGFMPEEIEQRLEKYHGVLTADGGEITAVEQWGKRQLAYPIRKETNGYYVIAQFTAQPEALPEFERRLKLDEDLLRHLIVISEGELPKPAASLEHGEPRPEASADAPQEEKATDGEEAGSEPAAADEPEEVEEASAESEEAADSDVAADEVVEDEPADEQAEDSGDEEKGS